MHVSRHEKQAEVMTGVSTLLDRVVDLQAAFAVARARDADLLAPDFSVFQFIRADELQLSNIIAWLLSPTGSHGQGSRFLHRFVLALGVSWDETTCGNALVRTEDPASRLEAARRIDILIQSGDRAIAIENKPAAADQPRQVQDYLTHLDQEFKGGRCLVYLSATGSPPSESSIPALDRQSRLSTNELVVMGYGDLLPWIEACKSICRADRISFFLDEFHRYIQQRFLGIRDVTERDQIAAEMAGSSEAISASFQVIGATEQMKNILMGKLEGQLRTEAKNRGWKLSLKTGPDRSRSAGARGTGFLIQFGEMDSIAFAVGFGNDQRSYFAYGVNVIGSNAPDGVRVHGAMTRAFGPGQTWPVWPWGKPAQATSVCQSMVIGLSAPARGWRLPTALWPQRSLAPRQRFKRFWPGTI